jgi:copper chaperone CopZ
MKREQIIIANLKCGGCESTIKNKLMELEGVNSVDVNADTDTVTVNFIDPTNRLDLTKKLHSLGYPEATEENGLLLKLKSYASCVAGRVDNMKHS